MTHKKARRLEVPVDIPELVIDEPLDENKERGNWNSQIEFLLSGLSYAVGLGNVWRFPYLCYRNGGGAFLIPYTIMLLFVGLPLFLMELGFGQYASEGPITIWKISPLFKGIGYAMFLMSGLVGIYYNMILAWALFYFFSSFQGTLPWSNCDNEWNTDACRRHDTQNCTLHEGTMTANGTCVHRENVHSDEEWNRLLEQNSKMPSDEYFHNFVLGITEGLHDLGGMRISLAVCLFLCWTCVLICLARGVKSMGKVVYFTSLFPYFVLTSLLIRALTLPGSIQGIIFYLSPDWSVLSHANVWADAAMQIFFSLSPCWGGLITLASYNKFHNNFYRDTMFIAFGNCGTSLFAGFAIFAVIGFMAHELSVPVSAVAKQGPGLAFVAYPEGISRFPLAPVWSVLFFAMLLTLGLGTQFTLIETVVTTIVDTWPDKLRFRKPLVLTCTCTFMFFAGLIMCTDGGIYVLQLMDNYCASFSALIIGLVEVIVIGWIYGIDRFLDDCRVMLGHYPYSRLYWKIVWKFVTPMIIVFILVFSLLDIKPNKYGNYEFPMWSTVVGWMLSLFSVSAIPIVMVLQLSKEKGSLIEKIKRLIRPTSDWGPMLQAHRIEACYSPKHIDSQVPLAGTFDDENEEDNFEVSSLSSSSDDDKRRKHRFGAYEAYRDGKRVMCLRNESYLNDETSDSEAGLRLQIPSPDQSPSRLLISKSDRKTDETNF